MKVCYFGTYRANYSRNQIMIEGLRRNGVEVIECHENLWHGIEDRVDVASGGWLRFSFVIRVICTYWRLLYAYRGIGDYDVMVVGYPGQIDIYLARLLTWLRGRPLVLDVFMSLYLIASERGITDEHPLTARLIYLVEKLAYLLPDLLIQDTAEYVEWFQEMFGLASSRFRLVPTGADDRVFYPVEVVEPGNNLFRVLYYGTFIPNHGVKYIIEAARLLQDKPDIRFELIGTGPTKSEAMSLAEKYKLDNITFVEWVDKHDLPRKIATADVCLGVFGTTPQSLMTVQNKIYEGLAMGKPVITGDGPAVRQTLIQGKHLYLCERANSQALAKAIRQLRNDSALCDSLSHEGRAYYLKHFTVACIGQYFRKHLTHIISRGSSISQVRKCE